MSSRYSRTAVLEVEKKLARIGLRALAVALAAGLVLAYFTWDFSPFRPGHGNKLAGDLADLGQIGGMSVARVTFSNGQRLETLATGKIYLITVPDDPEIPALPLDRALKYSADPQGPVNYFGYKYSSVDAAEETLHRNDENFLDRFPGDFFASDKALEEDAAFGGRLQAFVDRTGAELKSPSELNGVSLQKNSQYMIIVNENRNTVFRIKPELIVAGTLTVSTETYPPERQLLAGALNESVYDLSFAAETEPVSVTWIELYVKLPGSVPATNSLELWTPGSPNSVAVATRENCLLNPGDPLPGDDSAAPFCAEFTPGSFIIDPGEIRHLSVRPRLKTDAENFTLAPVNFQILLGDYETSGREGTVRAIGLDSGLTYIRSGNLPGETGVVRIAAGHGKISEILMAKITAVFNASPEPDGTLIQQGISNLGIFSIETKPNENQRYGLNDVMIDRISFTVEADNVGLAGNGFELFETSNPTRVIRCAVGSTELTGRFTVECLNPVDDDLTRIAGIIPNRTAFFVLRGDVTSPKINSDQPASLQVSIEDLGLPDTPGDLSWYDMDPEWDGSGLEHVILSRWVEGAQGPLKSTLYVNP